MMRTLNVLEGELKVEVGSKVMLRVSNNSQSFRTTRATRLPSLQAAQQADAQQVDAEGAEEADAQDAQQADAQAANDRKGEAKTLKLLAQIRLEKEEPGEALRAAEQAFGLYRTMTFPSRASRDAEILCLKAMVDAQAAMGSLDEGMRLAGEQQRRYKGLKDRQGEGSALLMMAKLHQLRGETEDALNALVQSPALFLAVGDRRGEGEAWLLITKIHLSKGDIQQAQRAAEECALAYRTLSDKKGRAEAAQLVADVHFALASIGMGNPQEALKASQEAVQLYQDTWYKKPSQLGMAPALLQWEHQLAWQELGEKQQAAISMHILANANLMNRNFEDALKAAQDAETAFRALRDTVGEAQGRAFVVGPTTVDDGRRAPGEVSTYKQSPGSAMESTGGRCGKAPDGVHHWNAAEPQLVEATELPGGLELPDGLETAAAERVKMECQVCGYSSVPQWLNDQAHCLKCNAVLRVREDLHGQLPEAPATTASVRRKPGEVSTYKHSSGSAMESAGGTCAKAPDGQHHWKYGKCNFCQIPEGKLVKGAGALANPGGKGGCQEGGKCCSAKAVRDYQGQDSIEDFMDHVEGYEKGRQNLDDFRGFSMRRSDPLVAKGGGARRERAPRKPRQMSNISDIELIKTDTSKEGKVTLAFFDGFESRSAGGGSRPAPKAADGGPGGARELGVPEKERRSETRGSVGWEQVLYSVRWVQASAGKAQAAAKKTTRREFTKDEDKRLVSTGQLGAPKDRGQSPDENWGGAYGKSERLEAVSGKRGV
eukprot:g657.t1